MLPGFLPHPLERTMAPVPWPSDSMRQVRFIDLQIRMPCTSRVRGFVALVRLGEVFGYVRTLPLRSHQAITNCIKFINSCNLSEILAKNWSNVVSSGIYGRAVGSLALVVGAIERRSY